MNPKTLYREIGLLDSSLIEEAQRKKHTGVRPLRWLPIAACLALAFSAAGIWQSGLLAPLMTNPAVDPPGVVASDEADDRYALTLNHATVAMAASRAIEGHFWQTLTAAETKAVFPAAEGRGDDYEINANANFSKTEAGVQLVDVIGTFITAEGITAQVIASPEKIFKCYLMDGKPVQSEIGGVSIDAGYFDDTNDKTILYYADFMLEDVYYSVELQGGKGEKAALAALLDHLISSGKADFSAISPTPPAELRNAPLTLQEARADESFGAFLPRSFPKGFALNEARRFVNQQSDFLSVSLSNGMNNILWRVSYRTDLDQSRITSAADTRNYDVSLYPIPRADSVPKELREIVDYPIFNIEELTLQVVKARAYKVLDAGDTDGWRMDFGVLYGDVLVEVSAKGVTPEELFAALTEIAPA